MSQCAGKLDWCSVDAVAVGRVLSQHACLWGHGMRGINTMHQSLTDAGCGKSWPAACYASTAPHNGPLHAAPCLSLTVYNMRDASSALVGYCSNSVLGRVKGRTS